jgi:amidohydrolase
LMVKLNIEALKSSVIKDIDGRRRELRSLSLKIHAHPELGYKEVEAAAWLGEYLEKNGFRVERGIYGLPTAFRASYGKGRPSIALLAEYDALPGVGHACGHNLIAGCAMGGAVASRLAVDRIGGRVLVFGTPAEELFGGKMVMVKAGAFNDVDAVMMVHPGSHNIAVTEALACIGLDVEFFGKAAHASAQPELGINALEAMILSFNAINSLRQHIRSSARIHGIITDGGEAANVVPAHSAGTFIVRARDDAYLDVLMSRTLDCFAGAAAATGARLEYRWSDLRYAPLRNNPTLARLFRQNLQATGRRVYVNDPSHAVGSTDMGNVSQVAPGIHPNVAIAPENVLAHSPEFAAAAASDAGIEGMLDAARALAGTVVDLLSNPDTVKRVRQEFARK